MLLTKEHQQAVELLRQAELDTDNGMPEELFLLVSSLVPLPNVDLLVVDQKGRILLSRRNDPFYQKSWHIPGGCLRFNEDFAQRIQKTARIELGSTITFDEKPLAVRNVIRRRNENLPFPRERGHNVAILFRCYLPDGYEIKNNGLNEDDDGFLKWFDRLPEDFLELQHVFDDILEPWR